MNSRHPEISIIPKKAVERAAFRSESSLSAATFSTLGPFCCSRETHPRATDAAEKLFLRGFIA